MKPISRRQDKEYSLCLIMPAKNVQEYISEAILSYISHNRRDVLLIIIDDHSSDETFNICLNLEKKYTSKILLKKNKLSGKVNAINYGFSLANASFYKFVDADDVLKESFWDMFERNSLKKVSFVHPFETVTESLEKIEVLPMAYQSKENYKKYIKNLILLPKVAWTFYKRDIDEMFPIPSGIPFEDIWLSMFSYAKGIEIINETKPVYLYRQHESQTYGNVKNINEERTVFRFNRIYKALKEIEKNALFKSYKNELSSAKVIALFMLRKVSFKIIIIRCGFFIALKHILLRDYKSLYEFARFFTWELRKAVSMLRK